MLAMRVFRWKKSGMLVWRSLPGEHVNGEGAWAPFCVNVSVCKNGYSLAFLHFPINKVLRLNWLPLLKKGRRSPKESPIKCK